MRANKINAGVTNFIPRTTILDKYLSEIAKYEILTKEQTLELVIKAQDGDRSAINTLVKSNQRFVFAICKKYANGKVDLLMELISEANIGLIKGIEKFDVKAKNTLLTYAVHWIEKYVLSYITFADPIIKVSNKLKTLKIPQIKNEFFLKNGVNATTNDIITILKEKYDIEFVDETDVYGFACYSLDFLTGDDESSDVDKMFYVERISEMYDVNDYEKEIDLSYNKAILNHSIGKLTESEGEVIRLLFGIENERPYEVSEVAESMLLTESGVRMIRDRSLGKLKKSMVFHS